MISKGRLSYNSGQSRGVLTGERIFPHTLRSPTALGLLNNEEILPCGKTPQCAAQWLPSTQSLGFRTLGMQSQIWLQVIEFLKSQREAGPKVGGNSGISAIRINTLVQQPATVFISWHQKSGYFREPNIFQVLCQVQHSVSLEVSSGHPELIRETHLR